MLYARMTYVLRNCASLTAGFSSAIGVLTGDTASPILWNIYFADVGADLPDSRADVVLHDRFVSHVEQADDVALFSTSLDSLQCKVDGFLNWCDANHMSISTPKSKWMIMGLPGGRIRLGDLKLRVRGEEIERVPVSKYKFVGVWFTSTARDIFEIGRAHV
jgi:hypothetical protein